jgi:hypothetical protein
MLRVSNSPFAAARSGVMSAPGGRAMVKALPAKNKAAKFKETRMAA